MEKRRSVCYCGLKSHPPGRGSRVVSQEQRLAVLHRPLCGLSVKRTPHGAWQRPVNLSRATSKPFLSLSGGEAQERGLWAFMQRPDVHKASDH